MELDNVQSNYKVSYQPSSDVQTQAPATVTTQAPAQEVKYDERPSTSQGGQQSAILELSSDANRSNVIEDKGNDKSKETDKNKNDKHVKDAVSEINKKIRSSHQELQMSQHAVTKAIMVKLVNSDTKEVVREFPPEKVQDMIAKMWEMAGIIVDEKR